MHTKSVLLLFIAPLLLTTPTRADWEWPSTPPWDWFLCVLNDPSAPTPDASSVTFHLFTRDNPSVPFDLTIGGELSTFFNERASVKIITHGFMADLDAASAVKNAYVELQTGAPNVIVVDWSSLSAAPDYCNAARNTRVVGGQIAALVQHIEQTAIVSPLRTYHLIGHSLGAHASAFAAKALKPTHPVERLTALDPAYPAFQDVSDEDRVHVSDAEFVDVIHTNGQEDGKHNSPRLGLGFTSPLGHVDYYPNGGHNQPGCCWLACLIPNWVCSHARAWDLMAESVRLGRSFPARKCDSWRRYVQGGCGDAERVYMGGVPSVGASSNGKYYLSTSDRPNYGQGTPDEQCFVLPCGSVPDPTIACPLRWVDMSFQDTLPPDAVLVHEGNAREHAVGRGEMGDRSYVVGRWAKDDGLLYSVMHGSVEVNITYQILTNPHGCTLSWEKQLSEFAVPTAPGYHTYVGRAPVGVLLSGQVAASQLSLVSMEKTALYATEFEVLASSQQGLDLHLSNFQFDDDVFAGARDFIGMEEVINNGEVTVAQSITHSKKIQSKNVLSTHHTWKTVRKICLKVVIKYKTPGGGNKTEVQSLKADMSVDVCNDMTKKHEEQKYFSTETEYEVTATREVTVGPKQAVKLCSSTVTVENFQVGFSAIGRYSAPGLSGAQVAAILAASDKYGEEDGEGGVLVEESGEFGGSVAFNPQFVIAPYEGIDACADLN